MAAAATPTIRAALRHAAARVDVLRPGRRMLVGFSGGQDSSCLLHSLAHLGQAMAFEVVAAHVDHALRPNSAADAERVAAIGQRLGVTVIVRRVDVGRYRQRLGSATVQESARWARYQALAAIQSEVDADALIVAHTADDQAETVLINLLRGAGVEGLAGMRRDVRVRTADYGPSVAEAEDWSVPPSVRVVRPLLAVERKTTRAYCVEQGLTIVEDPSNQSRAYTRNRVRLDLLPAMEQFNPAIRSVLSRLADLVGDDAAELEALGRTAHETLATPIEDGFRYDGAAWRARSRAIQRRMLRLAVRRLVGSLRDVPAGPIEDALDFVVAPGPPGRAYDLVGGVRLQADRSGLEVRCVDGRDEAAEI